MASSSPALGRTAKTSATAGTSSPKYTAASEPRMDYGRVIKLFTNEHTADLQDRQIAAVKRVVRVNADGYVADVMQRLCCGSMPLRPAASSFRSFQISVA